MNEEPACCLLSPLQVATWQLPDLATQNLGLAAGVPPWRVELPALQRGAVWRPRQVEALWDSLLRGFPIGAFLLAPYAGWRGKREAQYQKVPESGGEPDYHLIDGQQRWNAITLGFLNVWQRKDSEFKEALWLDLERPETTDGRLFLFRVVTRSHPWGYRLSDPSRPLEARLRRYALEKYKEAAERACIPSIDFRPGHFDIWHAWPWDAVAPVPFPLIVDAVRTSDGEAVWGEVKRLLNQYLPYWAANEPLRSLYDDWKQKVLIRLQGPTHDMQSIVKGIRDYLGVFSEPRYSIPVQILPEDVIGPSAQQPQGAETVQGDAATPDPIETLFVRVNSAGTTLDGEELRYSMLKAVYPAVQGIAEMLGTRLMSPARLVTLVSRLVLAQTNGGQKDPPREPDVARFRRLVHGDDQACPKFPELILDYLGLDKSGQPSLDSNSPTNGRAGRFLRQARELLVSYDDDHRPHDWRLPPVLAADLARQSPDTFFLLLAWLDRMANADSHPNTTRDDDQRRIVGTLTTLAWFAERPYDCLRALWQDLNRTNEPQQFFSAGVLTCCLKLTDRGASRLIPPLPPECLQEAVNTRVINDDKGFNDPRGDLWDCQREWHCWSERDLGIVEEAVHWFKRHGFPEDNRRAAWQGLIGRVWERRQFVLYAQRSEIARWFKDYDPAGLGQLEDTDRPWDFDHIHPYHYVGGRWGVPQIIREWHRSIGNLRAWPLEVNRAQGETAPRKKLKDPFRQEAEPPYTLNDGPRLRTASFIDEHNE